MLLSELIKELKNVLENLGEMECYTNGEHGNGQCEKLSKNVINVGKASLQFDTNYLDVDDNEIVCHIGGY